MKIEKIICDKCGGKVTTAKLKNGYRGWYCDKCKKIVIGKSILVEK